MIKLSASFSEAYLVDVVIHPRDLNLVFVAFSTGVVLFDLVSVSDKPGYAFYLSDSISRQSELRFAGMKS